MPTGTTIRRLLRRLLLWLAAALDEAGEPQPVTAGGPPADWLARVRRGAPDLLKGEAEGGVVSTRAESAPAPLRRRAPGGTAAGAEPRRTRAVVEEALVARKGRPGGAQERGVVPVRLHPVNEPELMKPAHSLKPRSSEALSAGPGWAGRDAQALLPAQSCPSLDASDDTFLMTSAATSAAEGGARSVGPAFRPGAAGAPTSSPQSGRQAFSFARFAGWNQGTPAIPGLKAGSTDLALPSAAAAGNDLERRDARWAGEPAPDAEDRARSQQRDDRWPELSPTATFERSHREEAIAEGDATAHRWPELPPRPAFAHEQLAPVESFDDADRLRRISDEQRRSGWSE